MRTQSHGPNSGSVKDYTVEKIEKIEKIVLSLSRHEETPGLGAKYLSESS